MRFAGSGLVGVRRLLLTEKVVRAGPSLLNDYCLDTIA
jgi:hypothetical protein